MKQIDNFFLPVTLVKSEVPVKIVFLCLFLFSKTIYADEFKVGVEELNYLPYFDGSGKQYNGYARELLDRFANSNGHKFIYVARPVARLYQEFLSGKVDFKFPDNPLWKKDLKMGKAVQYSVPLANSTDGVMMPIADMAKNEIKTIGIVNGFEPWPYMDQIKSGKIIIATTTDLESLLKQVSLKRIDGAYFNVLVAGKKINELELSKEISYNSKLPHADNAFTLSTIKKTKILKELDEYILKNAKLVSALKKKYGLQ